jgi:glycosyltransferase involved in cell wall biosynthesis
MKVSVVIPVYNEEKYIRSCLKSIFNQVDKADEVIVVDNNCTDRTIEFARKFPIKIIHEKKQGIIPARNKGFNTTAYSLILRTDADTRVPSDWVKRIKQYFIMNKDLVALSGSSRFYGLPKIIKKTEWPVTAFFKSFKQLYHHDCLYGPNMALRHSIWDKVKDEVCMRGDLVHEDIDLALHIAKYGEIMFYPDLIVASSPRRWKKLKPYIEYPYRYMKTIQKHNPSIITKVKRYL